MPGPQPEPQPETAIDPQRVEAILELLGRASEKFEPDALETWQWMASRAADPAVGELLLHDLTITMLRIVGVVGQGEPVNGITIAKQSGIPKGTVSKTTRKLVALGLLTQESLPNNRKEVLFRLTPLGRELYVVHRDFDAEMQRGFVRFLNRYDPAELDFIIRVLTDLLGVSFLSGDPD